MTLNEQEHEALRAQARQILESFSIALQNIDLPTRKTSLKTGGYREEEEGNEGNDEFRRGMMANASKHDDDFIFAEKKQW